MKRLALIILAVMLFSSCTPGNTSVAGVQDEQIKDKPLELSVITSYGGDDGNRQNYEDAVRAYEAQSGNTVKDMSGVANEQWKASVLDLFENNQEPDLLFFFTGADANTLIANDKVVSIEQIREHFPDYASNMKDEYLPVSPLDGKSYAVPVNGYWEGLFVNKAVLEDCGISVPDANTTWDEFMADCKTISDKGYIPIAASLNFVPHYWFEFCVLNNGSPATHGEIPSGIDSAPAKSIIAGLNDIKQMYESGFFPPDTLQVNNAETDALLIGNQAAFMIEGSWKMGWIGENASDVNNFTVTYVPGKGERKPTDIIGGISMGYFITKKAWADEAKRSACIDFVTAMTSDDVVKNFGLTAVTALKSGIVPPEDASSLVKDALSMVNSVTSVTPAAGDNFLPDTRQELFEDVSKIVVGEISAEQAVEKLLD